jgi:hypothetical protein
MCQDFRRQTCGGKIYFVCILIVRVIRYRRIFCSISHGKYALHSLQNSITYCLIPENRDLLEKLIVPYLVKKFPAFDETSGLLPCSP